jgi:hypothetical protein
MGQHSLFWRWRRIMYVGVSVFLAAVACSAAAAITPGSNQTASAGNSNAPDEQIVLMRRGDDRGESIYRVSKRHMLATKPWTPETQRPQLSIAGAISTARKQAKLARPQDFMLTRVAFERVQLDDNAELIRWFCQVQYYDVGELVGARPPAAKIIILLMDGSVVQPERSVSVRED